MEVAIHPDDYTAPGQPPGSDASSPRWASLLEAAGVRVRWVDVRRADILEQVRGCAGFMWRWAHFGGMHQIAHRLLPVLERHMGMVVYPDQNTCWHYDDKIAQAHLLEAAGLPIPRTWVWFDAKAAAAWVREACFPLVLKLATGAGSSNVRLVRDASEALAWIERLFGPGVADLDPPEEARWPWRRRLRTAAAALVRGRLKPERPPWPLHRGHVMFQEFLDGNTHDTRVAVVGHRAFGFRRWNREGDFRASGSGRIDHDPASVDPAFIRLAFAAARRLRMQSCAIDGLWRGSQPVIGEVSYTYVSAAVHACPGHWELHGEPESGELRWISGPMWPEEAQVQDFLGRLRQRNRT